eukprot:373655-Lingulodinium_polyedra.AAC.1
MCAFASRDVAVTHTQVLAPGSGSDRQPLAGLGSPAASLRVGGQHPEKRRVGTWASSAARRRDSGLLEPH